MKDARPELPTGTSAVFFFARCLWFAIWGGKFPFADSDTVKVDYLNGFYSFKVKATNRAAAAKRSGNWNYRGTFDPAVSVLTSTTGTVLPYMTFDVVLLGAGTAAGMYLSTIDINNNSPDTGIGWVQVSTGTGVWL